MPLSDEETRALPRVVAIDFDNVIHEPPYPLPVNGNIDERLAWYQTFGKPVEGAREALEFITAQEPAGLGLHYALCSCRFNPHILIHPGAKYVLGDALSCQLQLRATAWVQQHELPEPTLIAGYKPNALVYIDDRGLRFDGWDATICRLRALLEGRVYEPLPKISPREMARSFKTIIEGLSTVGDCDLARVLRRDESNMFLVERAFELLQRREAEREAHETRILAGRTKDETKQCDAEEETLGRQEGPAPDDETHAGR